MKTTTTVLALFLFCTTTHSQNFPNIYLPNPLKPLGILQSLAIGPPNLDEDTKTDRGRSIPQISQKQAQIQERPQRPQRRQYNNAQEREQPPPPPPPPVPSVPSYPTTSNVNPFLRSNGGAGGVSPVSSGPAPSGPAPSASSFPAPIVSEQVWPLAAGGGNDDTPQINDIQVQCEKNHIRVNIAFNKPFYGIIFSKGHFSNPNCVHLKSGSGTVSTTFEIFLNTCGMGASGNADTGAGQPNPTGSYIENTVIIQYDPQVQEVWDQARKLRCTWYDYYEKSVTFRPFQVDMLNSVTANFLGDNLQCWMQIQSGKGPWSSEVSGIVKIGQTMTMVLGIKDEENKFDMLVRNCVAHDGQRAPIQLVDELGCILRPKIMSNFQKVKNFGSSATVVSYAYFQAFKFPDSMNVHFQCVIQVCRYRCPEPSVCPNSQPAAAVESGYASAPTDAAYSNRFARRQLRKALLAQKVRAKRSADNETLEIPIWGEMRAVSPNDVAFSLNGDKPGSETVVVQQHDWGSGGSSEEPEPVCLSSIGFSSGLSMLLAVTAGSFIVGATVCLKGACAKKKALK